MSTLSTSEEISSDKIIIYGGPCDCNYCKTQHITFKNLLAVESDTIHMGVNGKCRGCEKFMNGDPKASNFFTTVDNKIVSHWHEKCWHTDQLQRIVEIEITDIAYDSKAIALRVHSPVPCQNSHPHLTLAHRADTPAVYSNTLLANPAFEYSLPLPIRVPARIIKYYKGKK